jgi:hypothetical protein
MECIWLQGYCKESRFGYLEHQLKVSVNKYATLYFSKFD